MIAESEALKYGALGFVAFVLFAILWLIVRPIIRSFVAELQANRKERTEQREQFLAYMENHAAGQIEAMHEVQRGLGEITVSLQQLNGRGKQER